MSKVINTVQKNVIAVIAIVAGVSLALGFAVGVIAVKSEVDADLWFCKSLARQVESVVEAGYAVDEGDWRDMEHFLWTVHLLTSNEIALEGCLDR